MLRAGSEYSARSRSRGNSAEVKKESTEHHIHGAAMPPIEKTEGSSEKKDYIKRNRKQGLVIKTSDKL